MSDEAKLLFNDLSMRLPFGTLVISTGSWKYKTPLTVENIWYIVNTNDKGKPILRPLSDLSDEQICMMGYEPDQIKSCIEDIHLGAISHSHFMYLIENHYDVSLLIERGIAVDVNTIETDPYK